MIRIVILVLLLLSTTLFAEAQLTRHLVYLKDKDATTHSLSNPSVFLSQRAIDRRTRYGIAIDSSDLPIPESYISQIQAIPGVTILNTSRWFNAVVIDTSDANALAAVNALSFVKESKPIAARYSSVTEGKLGQFDERPQGIESDYFNYGTGSLNEVKIHNGDFLHNIGLRGQGMQIAMLDAGFFNYTGLDAFDSVVIGGQVLSTWDFVNRETSVTEDHPHGMMCLSTIASNIPGTFIGKAPKASFHLFRTEDVFSEYPIEEFNWLCGAERADSSGADLISSSLGYNTFDDPSMNHQYADMDGNTIISSIAADIAARKGILVFQAIGNYGSDPWHYLATPADADSIISVGAVRADSVIWAGSSFGPSADGRVKPDAASIGYNAIVQGAGNNVGVGSGTSFATPNMAGMGACLWQGFPEFNNMRIVRAIREAGSIYNSPDDRIGFGIPDLKKAFITLLVEYAESSASLNNCNASISWNSKDVRAMKYELERKLPGEASFSKIADINPENGDVLVNHSYQYVDDLSNKPAGTVSYRIRQVVDTSATGFTAVHIDTTEVVLAAGCTTTSTPEPGVDEEYVSISPNPFAGMVTLTVQTINPVSDLRIVVADMSGRKVMERKESKGAGKKIFEVVTSGWASGVYNFSIFENGKLRSQVKGVKVFN